jgi:HEAT repeat protein
MSDARSKPTTMQRLRVWVLFAVFVMLWIPLWMANRPEPIYSEQPLSYWLERMSNPATASQAMSVVSEMGPEALPALVEALRTDSSQFRDFVYASAVRVRLAPPRRYDAPSIRATAAYLLGQMGVAAAGASDDLIKALDDDDAIVRFRASRALAQIGVPALPELVEAMTNSPSKMVRKLSVQTMGRMGPVAKRAAPALVHAQKTSGELTNEIREALVAIQR